MGIKINFILKQPNIKRHGYKIIFKINIKKSKKVRCFVKFIFMIFNMIRSIYEYIIFIIKYFYKNKIYFF